MKWYFWYAWYGSIVKDLLIVKKELLKKDPKGLTKCSVFALLDHVLHIGDRLHHVPIQFGVEVLDSLFTMRGADRLPVVGRRRNMAKTTSVNSLFHKKLGL